MPDLSYISSNLATLALPIALVIQCLVALAIISHNRSTRKRVELVECQIRGFTRKIEAITASKREHFIREYDAVISRIRSELPEQLASAVGDAVVDLEREVLSRLMELEGISNHDSAQKVEEVLIRMEALEESLVRASTDAVADTLNDQRERVLVQDVFSDLVKAA